MKWTEDLNLQLLSQIYSPNHHKELSLLKIVLSVMASSVSYLSVISPNPNWLGRSPLIHWDSLAKSGMSTLDVPTPSVQSQYGTPEENLLSIISNKCPTYLSIRPALRYEEQARNSLCKVCARPRTVFCYVLYPHGHSKVWCHHHWDQHPP